MGILLRPKVLAIIILALGSLVLGQTLLRFPFPPISVKPEKIAHHLFPLGPLGDFNITNTMISAWVGMALLLLMAFFATRKMGLIPNGWQNFVEAVIGWFYGLVEAIAGPKNARKFFPLVATIFLFVIVNNWISLLPGFNTVGVIESADVVIEHVVEEKAEEAEPHLTLHEAEEQLEEYVHLSPEDRIAHQEELPVGAAIFEELEEKELQLLDEVSVFSILPLSLHDQTMSAAEYLEHPPEEGKNVGLIVPFFRNTNTALNTTLAIAIIGMVMVEFWGIRALGFFGYASKFVAIGSLRKGIGTGLMNIFVGLLEGVSEIARVISFTFRLFGNMFAGEILIFVMSFLIPLALVVPFYGLELFVGFIQAVIFSILVLIFAMIAMAAHNGHGDETHKDETPEPATENEQG